MIHTDGVQTIANHPGIALPPVSPAEPVEVVDAREDIVALHGRCYAGLGVQLLWNRATGQTFITLTKGERIETFEVPRDKALDAFVHPYLYGGTA